MSVLCTVLDGYKTHFFQCICKNTNKSKRIPEYHSFRHAKDRGWTFTEDSKGSLIGICPECSKKEKISQ